MGHGTKKVETTDLDSSISHIVKTDKERFASYHCFRTQRIYYITIAFFPGNMVLKKCVVCQTCDECQQ